MKCRGVLATITTTFLLLGVSSNSSADDDASRWESSVAEAAFSIGAKRSVIEIAEADSNVLFATSPITIDDCSVFLAFGDRESPSIVQCVGQDIREPGFEMPPPPFFLVSAEGEILDDISDLPIVVTQAEFQRLPIERGELVMQPPSPEVLINIDTIAHSTARTHVLPTRILGTPVAVRATPIEWVWDFGAGTEPFVTDSPGGPYPNREVSRVYHRVAQDVTISLTIRWSGEYQVNNAGPWLPIAGTTTTSLTSPPFDTVEAPARLVTGALGDG